MKKSTLVSIFLSILILCSLINIFQASAEFDEPINSSQRTSGRATSILNDSTIKGNPVIYDETIYLEGNLTIEHGASLKLVNTSLIVNSSGKSGVVYKILVLAAGKLELVQGSSIDNNFFQSNKYELEFDNDSVGYIENSEISSCGHFSQEGLIVRSDQVTFINSTLHDNYIGINCDGASPTIKNCSIMHSDYAAIVCNNSKNVRIENCNYAYSGETNIVIQNNSDVTLLSTPISYPTPEIHDTSGLTVAWWLSVALNASEDDSPIENATVEVTDGYDNKIFSGNTNEFGVVLNIECVEFIQNTTDIDWFTPYTLMIAKDGYVSKKVVLKDITEDIELFEKLELRPPGGMITGFVFDVDNNPIKNATVSVKVDDVTYISYIDENGIYKLEDIPIGKNYNVTAEGRINNISAYELGMEKVNVTMGRLNWANFTLIEKELPVIVKVVSRNNPVNIRDADYVDIDTLIEIEFENPINESSLNDNLFLKLENTNIMGNLTLMKKDTLDYYIFQPNENLKKDRPYQFSIIKDVLRVDTAEPVFWKNYVVNFKTEFEPIIETGPSGSGIDPEIPNIYVRFDNRIKLSLDSLKKSFGLVNESNKDESGNVDLNTNLNRVNFIPDSNLKGSETYYVIVSDDLVDLDNNYILGGVGERRWSFTTKIVIITIDLTGKIVDKKTEKPIQNATIRIYDLNNTLVDIENSNLTGDFIIFDLDPGEYNIEILAKGFETKKFKETLTEDVELKILDDVTLSEKKGEDDDDVAPFDEGTLVILGVVILIIILIILFLAFRKPAEREVPYEGAGAEEAEVRPTKPAPPEPAYGRVEVEPSAAPATTKIQPAQVTTVPEAHYVEPSERPAVTTSIFRCPNCMHKLSSTGECFHCQMRERYGLW